ncbi:RNA-binding cell elongation regulator Jag/EloR [Alicyclobacillus sp. SO9]|uniref:RNA-binding cell elongation regulator Jag/EloR n=1 Tax=Alicyclobacillus sp. SO9 TaxID=2665646 RepID=UPI0018E7C776|nr:RNA-binding cell elongation regulator Jag/EloR [Alicyclobacillus sp. SO9]QQE78950.1 protein jag [Alicyclobacillus sp. SO9]
MKRVVSTGRTVEEAVTSALVKLGVSRTQASIKVLQEPSRGLFGIIGGRGAEVEVSVSLSPEDTAREFLMETLRKMGIEGRVRLLKAETGSEKEQVLNVQCSESDMPVVIGRHGATLDSLQYLVNIVANQENLDGHIRFTVDAGGYRERHKESIVRLAERAAQRAVRSRRSVGLEPMTAVDRKLVHTYLQGRDDVTTTSEGVDPQRKVVVIPVVNSSVGSVSGRRRSRPSLGIRPS